MKAMPSKRWLLVLTVLLGCSTPACAGPLHDAAKDGNLELIEELIAQGAEINEGTGFATPLYFAIQQGHSDAAELLIERGADVNAPSIGGTPLHAASRAGLAELVRLLLDRGANPNARTTTQTPLHLAARNGHIEVVRVLLARGADLNAVTGDDEPAIHFAAVGGHVDVINLLVEQGIKTPKVEEITTLLPAADLLRGKNLSLLCQACHSIDRARKTRTGPPLWGVVGRPKASVSDFDYTPALRSVGGNWTYDALNHFIAQSAWTVPGTSMRMEGVRSPKDRADLIAFLRTLSDDPPAP
jgi:cytochrome c